MTPNSLSPRHRVILYQYCVGLLAIGFGFIIYQLTRTGAGTNVTASMQSLLAYGSLAVITFGGLLVWWKTVGIIYKHGGAA